MSDELTPEEREAIDQLPRERMPAGLEARVVGAMQERGFLAGRRRTLVWSNSRVAGLLAASLVLIIGAYSIGLHRGSSDPVVPPEMPPRTDHIAHVGEQLESAFAPEPEDAARPAPETPAGSDEATEARPAPKKERQEEPVTTEHDVAESLTAKAPAPASALNRSARFRQDAVAPETAPPPLTFLLDGTPVFVEAPDSVRVVQDESGRILIIHTSDGIIRIRLADD
jgi:hypothetical protein